MLKNIINDKIALFKAKNMIRYQISQKATNSGEILMEKFFDDPKEFFKVPDGFVMWNEENIKTKSRKECISLWFETMRFKNKLLTMQHESIVRKNKDIYVKYQRRIDDVILSNID